MSRSPSRASTIAIAAALLGSLGCHSAMVDATIHNHSGATLNLVEVDYPSASFGTQNLADGADFHYRFKVLGNGPLKLTYTDTSRHDHSSTGPNLAEGSEGLLNITVNASETRWQTTFKQPR